MHYQVQARESAPPHRSPVEVVQEQVQEEIQRFLQALDSYPARVAKQPRVTFHQHLSSLFAARGDDPSKNDRSAYDRRPRRQ